MQNNQIVICTVYIYVYLNYVYVYYFLSFGRGTNYRIEKAYEKLNYYVSYSNVSTNWCLSMKKIVCYNKSWFRKHILQTIRKKSM